MLDCFCLLLCNALYTVQSFLREIVFESTSVHGIYTFAFVTLAFTRQRLGALGASTVEFLSAWYDFILDSSQCRLPVTTAATLTIA
jgi:hypothetical protein